MIIIAIDPGSSSGALAIYDSAVGKPKCVHNMPGTYLDIWNYLKPYGQECPENVVALMENVGGSRPGNSAKSSHTFAEHVGALKMALLAAGIPCGLVPPRAWLTTLFGESYPKGSSSSAVRARKHFTRDKMQRIYPTIEFTLRQADAVAIMEYGRRLHRV